MPKEVIEESERLIDIVKLSCEKIEQAVPGGGVPGLRHISERYISSDCEAVA